MLPFRRDPCVHGAKRLLADTNGAGGSRSPADTMELDCSVARARVACARGHPTRTDSTASQVEAVEPYGDPMHLPRWILTALLCTLLVACNHDDPSRRAPPPTPAPVTARPGSMPAPRVTPVSAAAPASAAAIEPVPETPSALARIESAESLAAALAIAGPELADTTDELGTGALLLTAWSSTRMRWPDVSVAKNETSFALVHKDSDAARGKRMCVRGSLIQISKESVGSSAVFIGLLMSGYTDLVHFVAVGSTGELVERSRTRLCGVVTGTYDYANSGGGTGHAINVVGMFDLPENRKAL